jgi:hypothetical protein
VFNQAGDVIGVATGIFAEGQNLNFAVPSNYVRDLLAKPSADLAVAAFAAATAPRDASQNAPKILRRIPTHDLSMLDGCSRAQLAEMADAISQAISIGAPLYNQGNHEACFRVYEGVVVKFEGEPPCPGVRAAFGDGLLRASAMNNYTEKAWAMRDTFDGMLDVIVRRARAGI